MNDAPLMTTDELLEYLHLNLKTVYRLIRAGKLPAVRVGRQWRFRRQDVDAWLAAESARGATRVERHRSTVLVVDDVEGVRGLIADALATNPDLDVALAADGPSALELLKSRVVDLLITDLKMPGMDGLTLVRKAREHKPDLPVVIITGVPSEASAIDAVNLGVSGYLLKPFRVPHVLETVARGLASAR